MLGALKSSAVAYLGTTFCFVDIAVPNHRKSYQKDVIQAAVKAHILRQTFPTQSAGKVAMIANEPPDAKLPDEQITLAIDYSRSGLNLESVNLTAHLIGEMDRCHAVATRSPQRTAEPTQLKVQLGLPTIRKHFNFLIWALGGLHSHV
jgi:hypothetical protein